ncbi:hypothetical protein [Mechercharimyces sp. CAU 1602]|uniref:hypothetical protein n=1 Tax=Mechercharimyces sp. CAU 1602 TaxID=2973933 RepID=UPI0021617DFD|nr:hypothetical protein [Mechercharimyces sp. CAU 1602]MCS1351140.1 hypothetical protein [Mechercharimyces sp. CAU 1602]
METPTFHVYPLEKDKVVYIELDPQDGGNFQSHQVAMIKEEKVIEKGEENNDVERVEYKLLLRKFEDTGIIAQTKDEATKKACSQLMSAWLGE